MGRSASERVNHLRFTNLQLMKNLKNFWNLDEAKKHGSCYFNSIYLLCFYECDPDHILPLSSSDYYSVSEMNSIFGNKLAGSIVT